MGTTYRDLQKVIGMVEKAEGITVQEDPWRLGFHLMPPVGWLNDPNGLCFFKGKYHVFFQYSPFNAEGGIKVWGHYTSLDLIHWEYEGVPIVPDEAEDCHGVYSGSIFVEDEKAYLYYTGNVKRLGDYDYINSGREANTILIESDDLCTYEEKKCIMTNSDYTEKMSCHVRDPKVWKEADTYYMVQGARTKKGVGEVLVFESKDKINWKLINEITSKEAFGYMWECPDLFQLDGVTFLTLSPQGIEPKGFEYWNIYQSGYYLVEGDFRSQYSLSTFCELDRGFDFYAPQTFEDEKGRRLLIGWMGLPDDGQEYTNPTVERGWQHCLTLPRQLHVKQGKLYQTPIEELKQLRKHCTQVEVEEQCALKGSLLDEINIKNISKENDFELLLNKEVVLSYSKKEQVLTLQFLNESGAGRDKRMVTLPELKEVQVFRDYSAIEIFINEGEEVFSTRYYPKSRDNTIDLSCKYATLTVWELGEMSYGI